MLWADKFSLKQIDDDSDEKVPGDEEGNETPEQLRTYFTLNDNLKPVGVRRQSIVSLDQYWWYYDYYHNDHICFIWQMTIQGQFGGLSLPEVEEDAWSVKDYIEWKRNQVDQAFDLKKTQWHPMTWKRHNKKDTINNSSDTQCHLEKTHWLGRTSSWRLQKHKMTHKHTKGRQKLLDNDSIKNILEFSESFVLK